VKSIIAPCSGGMPESFNESSDDNDHINVVNEAKNPQSNLRTKWSNMQKHNNQNAT
jgi:hypothetical protein